MNALLRFATWLTFTGSVATLLGLAWDARLHRLDPTLAAREGVFTLSNPGHLLFASGLAIVVTGTIVLILGPALRRSGASFARRAAAVSAAVALVFLSVVTFASAVSGQDSQGHDDHSGHGNMAAPAATPEQRAAAAKLLAEVRAGVAPYADFSTARTAGYRQVTPWRYLTWGPAHFQNFAYTRDGVTLDPSRPEDLVFMRLPRGQVVLIGAMFLAPKGAGPRPGGPLTEWHTHDNLCVTATGTVALAKGPGQCPAGSFFIGEAVEMLHVWTFDNPDGPFAHSISPQAIQAALRQFGGR